MTDKYTVIESPEYESARQRLMEDPIVIDMAKGLAGVPKSELAHESGSPRFQFMQAANDEYDKRGGSRWAHIGAVAEALLRLLEAS